MISVPVSSHSSHGRLHFCESSTASIIIQAVDDRHRCPPPLNHQPHFADLYSSLDSCKLSLISLFSIVDVQIVFKHLLQHLFTDNVETRRRGVDSRGLTDRQPHSLSSDWNSGAEFL